MIQHGLFKGIAKNNMGIWFYPLDPFVFRGGYNEMLLEQLIYNMAT